MKRARSSPSSWPRPVQADGSPRRLSRLRLQSRLPQLAHPPWIPWIGSGDLYIIWLVVSTPLKNISQLGWFFPIYGKRKKCSKPPTRYTYIYIYTSIYNYIYITIIMIWFYNGLLWKPYIYIYTDLNKLSYTKCWAIWGWFPLIMIPVRENSEVVIIYPNICIKYYSIWIE